MKTTQAPEAKTTMATENTTEQSTKKVTDLSTTKATERMGPKAPWLVAFAMTAVLVIPMSAEARPRRVPLPEC